MLLLVFWLVRAPVDGRGAGSAIGVLVGAAFGLGGVFAGVQTASQAGVPPRLAGLASALINASFQVGAALGLAIFRGEPSSEITGSLFRWR